MSFWLNDLYSYYSYHLTGTAWAAILLAALLCGLLAGVYVRHGRFAVGSLVTGAALFFLCGLAQSAAPAGPVLSLLAFAVQAASLLLVPLCLGISVGYAMSLLSGMMMNRAAPANK